MNMLIFIISVIVISRALEEAMEAGMPERLFIAVGISCIVMIMWMLFKEAKRDRRLRREKIEEQIVSERKRRESHEREQERLRSRASNLVFESKNLAKSLPTRVDLAEAALAEAEREFEERAFAPFWDAVERAVTSLGHFNEEVNNVIANSREHQQLILDLAEDGPEFSVSLNGLPDPRTTWRKLQYIPLSSEVFG